MALSADEAPHNPFDWLRTTTRMPRRGRGLSYGATIEVLWPLISAAAKQHWYGGQHVPREGGVLIAANHVSYADPVTVSAFLLAAGGRVPRYLARNDMWNWPVIGPVMRSGKHIPVERGTANAIKALNDAAAAVRAGECVVVFPEGTFTRREDGWPDPGIPGIGRLALTTGAPVIPLANWGTQNLLPHPSNKPKVWPRQDVHMAAGAPVDLSDLAGPRVTRSALDIATKRIMGAITGQLATIRGEEPPADLPAVS
ncbi:1-acyl-sn-glycerol-3-phosphate acyltransferase [Pseudonocardiaceae bacterium YIM PH 21723]|nr:1-acyl-sn-glycerol-3-phosphate acyltransferase [Pseudonocardiaceae bacterium YIM PH 21723]